jgi:hypothetical protein
LEVVMSANEWAPERRVLAAKASRLLRKEGYSYEDIALGHLGDSEGNKQMEPWEVYAFCNPGKTPAQVQAWKTRHYPHG